MESCLYEKLNSLKGILSSLDSVVVALSGGVDSAFLTRVAAQTMPGRIVALSVRTFLQEEDDLLSAARVADSCGIPHRVIPVDLDRELLRSNPPDRCYHCKKALFSAIRTEAERLGSRWVAEGSNIDDEADYRPGLKALQELGIRSPLQEARLAKREIRSLAHYLGYEEWNLPAQSCMATRFAFGTEVSLDRLHRVREAEAWLKNQGLEQVRVRYHGELARIEVGPGERSRFFSMEFQDSVAERFKKLGFKYITLDLEGYRTGSMNDFSQESRGLVN